MKFNGMAKILLGTAVGAIMVPDKPLFGAAAGGGVGYLITPKDQRPASFEDIKNQTSEIFSKEG